jgi:hypothetical protein
VHALSERRANKPVRHGPPTAARVVRIGPRDSKRYRARNTWATSANASSVTPSPAEHSTYLYLKKGLLSPQFPRAAAQTDRLTAKRMATTPTS